MRIAHLSCVAPPEIGGIGKVAEKEVALLRSRGQDARLIAPEPRVGNAAAASPGRLVASATKDLSFVERAPTLWRIGNASWLTNISERVAGYDLLHIHWPFFGTADRLLLRPVGLPPIVVTYHMDAMASGPEMIPILVERLLLQSHLLSNAKKIIVSSFDYASSCSIAGLLRRNPERFIELPFGVDTDVFSPGDPERVRFLVPESAPCVIFVGGLSRTHSFKGLPILLEVMSKFASDLHLLVVGDGDLRSEFEERSRQLGIRERTHFLGALTQTDLVVALRSADAFVFPSTSRAEAFGLAALEAEAVGLPVIASDLPGVRTVVKQNETGLLVPPNNADALASGMRTLLEDRGLRLRLGNEARRHAERLSWDAHIDGLERVYEKVCASPS